MPPIPGDEDQDDSSIPDDAKVLRRIPPSHVVKNDSTGRPQTRDFDNSPDGSGTSVRIWADGTDPLDVLKDHDDFGLVFITAKDIRDNDLGIILDPDPDPNDPHHALIQGKKKSGRKKRLASAAIWIKKPNPE